MSVFSNSILLFLDDDNNQVIINKDNLDELIYVTRISQDYISSIKYLFVYFDQKHITGVDVKLIPLNAKGLVTIKYNTTIRDYGQGTYRLRKINQTQSIDIISNLNLEISKLDFCRSINLDKLLIGFFII